MKIDHEKLIQELHAHDVRNCPNPPKLEDRAPFVRRYYEDTVEVVCRHVASQNETIREYTAPALPLPVI